ncbi:formyltransferase family protein, partial [Actinomyces sp. MRS3W]|uniref:formyltransferase family protein n=1 Tax=Actinomyces sp. MRS3W TaxID=2800796 RepID=UPI0028FD2E74
MRVLFAGTPEVALPALGALLAAPEHEVVGVLTRADARKGRGRSLHPSPVAAAAREAGLDVRTPTTLREEDVQAWVRELRPDVAVVVAYGRLVPA